MGIELDLNNLSDNPEDLQIRARSAQLSLLMVNKADAARSLSPFVRIGEGRQLILDYGQLRRLQEHRFPFSAGIALAQIADLMFRSLESKRGSELAASADALLSKHDDTVPYEDRFLARRENEIWWCRLLWRAGEHRRAESLLSEAVNELRRSLQHGTVDAAPVERGGVELLIAVALGLWASFDWMRGLLNDARRKVYEALFLLGTGDVDDPIRLAHALFTAGRIEAPQSTIGFSWSLNILQRARRLYEANHHPFVARTIVQQSQCLLKMGRADLAEILLQEVDHLTTAIIADEDEKVFARAEAQLTRLWILEEKAIETGDWVPCKGPAEALEAAEGLPSRVGLENMLHQGRVLVHLEDRRDLDRGRNLLDTVVRESQNARRLRIEVGAYFALVESYLEGIDRNPELAREYWEKALRLRTSIESTYLARWEQRLGPKFDGPFFFSASPNLTLHDARDRFEAAFLGHVSSCSRNTNELINRLGVAKSTFWFLLKRHNIRTRASGEQGRGQRGKGRSRQKDSSRAGT